jgi:aminoglycoside 2'-N-acetyltransferase I
MVTEIVAYPESEVPPKLRQQVVALQQQAWPADGPPDPVPWHDPALRPVSVILLEEGRVVAALDILSKQIEVNGQSYAASGLSTVVTDQQHRRMGYGRQIVRAAGSIIEASGADLGIFTCDRYLQSFYEAAGWQRLPGTVLVGGTPQDPFPSDPVRQGHDGFLLLTPCPRRERGVHRGTDRALPRRDRQAVVRQAFSWTKETLLERTSGWVSCAKGHRTWRVRRPDQ